MFIRLRSYHAVWYGEVPSVGLVIGPFAYTLYSSSAQFDNTVVIYTTPVLTIPLYVLLEYFK